MKTLIFRFLLIWIFSSNVSGFGQNHGQPYSIKSVEYWTYPVLTLQEAKDLAPYSLIIIELDNLFNNRASLARIKELNPQAKLICYSNPMEFFSPVGDDRPIQKKWAKLVEEKYPNWQLKTAAGGAAIFWPGMIMLNLSAACPTYNIPGYGQVNYTQWMAQELLSILADTLWDGYYMDNGGGNISWLYQESTTQIDADNNGRPDDQAVLDSLWSQGIHDFLSQLRTARDLDFLLLANKGSLEFLDVLNGRFFEGFSCDYLGDKKDGGWHQCLANAIKIGPLTIFQVKNDEDLEYGLASALLIDAYIAIGQDNLRHYPQLNYDLGKPVGVPMKLNNLFFREFEHGRVEVRPDLRQGKVILH